MGNKKLAEFTDFAAYDDYTAEELIDLIEDLEADLATPNTKPVYPRCLFGAAGFSPPNYSNNWIPPPVPAGSLNARERTEYANSRALYLNPQQHPRSGQIAVSRIIQTSRRQCKDVNDLGLLRQHTGEQPPVVGSPGFKTPKEKNSHYTNLYESRRLRRLSIQQLLDYLKPKSVKPPIEKRKREHDDDDEDGHGKGHGGMHLAGAPRAVVA